MPPEIRKVIAAGWEKMSEERRAYLLRNLADQPNSIQQALIASQAAAETLLT
jgi:hypothetical protein